jgi:hypothetical protein
LKEQAQLMAQPLVQLQDLSDEQLACDGRVGMQRLLLEFLLQQEYFTTAAMMIAEYIASIQRLEEIERSGLLSTPSIKQAAILWRNEVRGFKHWYKADNDETIAELMQELSEKGFQQFVYDLALELRVNRR